MPSQHTAEVERVAGAREGDVAVSIREIRKYFYFGKKIFGLATKSSAVLRAVDDVSLDVPAGRTYCLVGESGCGKSTLARLIGGLLNPTAGTIRINPRTGASQQELSADESLPVQMIFQDPYASLNPRWRVGRIIAEPLRAAQPRLRRSEIADRVAEYLSIVGLSAGDARKYPHEFSGGQRQRISIARALIVLPRLLICDEPTSALDVSVQAQILNLMKDLQERFALSCLFISHNLAAVAFMADYVGVMYLGKLVENGPAETVLREPLHPYTRMLLDTIPDIDQLGRQRLAIAGEVPNPLRPPSGCRFHTRCPFALPKCREEEPALLPKAGRTVACHVVHEGEAAPPSAN